MSKPSPTQSAKVIQSGGTQWQVELLDRIRTLLLSVNPEIIEERKWKKPSKPDGVPVWSLNGILCTGETYKDVVKLTFAHGASLEDPKGIFNASLDGNTRRAIDLRKDDKLNEAAFKALIRAAIQVNDANVSVAKKKPSTKRTTMSKRKDDHRDKSDEAGEAKPVKLLSGGNPQIAKADGDAPVQAYIAAMPGWKRAMGERLDALIVRAVPNVRKAVKWNSPLYGIEGSGWFLGVHCFTKYIKIAFFFGSSLKPLPPGESKDKNTRYLDIRENDVLDEAQLASWFKQAAAIPGWDPGKPA